MLDYPSNISRKQFEHVKPILESAKKSTRPRTLDLSYTPEQNRHYII